MPSGTNARPLLAELTDIFRCVLNQPELELTPRSTADDVLGWDSMTHVTLLVEAECRFGIEFQTTEIEAVHSVGELLRTIETKRAVRITRAAWCHGEAHSDEAIPVG